jgi:hypothetical protein
VRGSGYFRDDVHFELPLRDDGTDGDEVAGDHVFSGVAEVGADVAALEYNYWLGDTAEFTPLPPLKSTSGTRLVRLGGETVTPVVRFAERPRMAERTHPNADGQAVIAERLAAMVEAQASFQSWLGACNGTPSAPISAAMGRKVFVVGVGMTKFEKPGSREAGTIPTWRRKRARRRSKTPASRTPRWSRRRVGYCYGDSTCGQRAVYQLGMTGIPSTT